MDQNTKQLLFLLVSLDTYVYYARESNGITNVSIFDDDYTGMTQKTGKQIENGSINYVDDLVCKYSTAKLTLS